MMQNQIPIAVTTGTLFPLPTLESIQHLREIGIRDIELTLQQNEFSLGFDRKLSMPILPALQALVQSGELRVRSVHAPMVHSERAYNLWARLTCLLHSIEVCAHLEGRVVVVHPFHLFRTHEDALEYLSRPGIPLSDALLPGIYNALERARALNVTLALENIQDWLNEIFFNAPEPMRQFLNDMEHPSLKFTFDLMHAQAAGTLDAFTDSLAEHIVNIHASDLLPPTKRVAIGRGVIDWQCLLPKLQALPNLRQITVELANPQTDELAESVRFLSTAGTTD